MKNRCHKGTRRNKKTGDCEKHVVKEKKRCTNGTRKNKKTGKCEDILKETCSICLDKLGAKRVKTQCKHQFHEQCLIGWCKNNQYDKVSCPICRQSIVKTCKKIMPSDSKEIFRYIPSYGTMSELQYEQAEEVMHHKDFDVNVSTYRYGETVPLIQVLILHIRDTEGLVEYLLKQPALDFNKEFATEIVTELISTQSYNSHSQNMLRLLKKYKKIPKHLKNLI